LIDRGLKNRARCNELLYAEKVDSSMPLGGDGVGGESIADHAAAK
jgi:hypothetical protein